MSHKGRLESKRKELAWRGVYHRQYNKSHIAKKKVSKEGYNQFNNTMHARLFGNYQHYLEGSCEREDVTSKFDRPAFLSQHTYVKSSAAGGGTEFLALVTEGTAVERPIAERFLTRRKKEGKKKHPPRMVADQSGTFLEKDGSAISERASEIKSDALSDAKPATLRGWASCANDQGRREGKTGTVSAPRHSTASRL